LTFPDYQGFGLDRFGLPQKYRTALEQMLSISLNNQTLAPDGTLNPVGSLTLSCEQLDQLKFTDGRPGDGESCTVYFHYVGDTAIR
jgi:hypothetical protein